jgi:DegV family protein with EDD domain
MDPKLAQQHQVHILPLNVIFGEKNYREGLEIGSEEFYEKMKTEPNLPTTSQPAIGSFVELYKELKKTFDKGIAIHVSAIHSGTFSTSKMAADLAEFPVEAIDSKTALYPMSQMILEGIRLQQEGKTYQEIINRIRELTARVKLFFLVDDLAHLQRGGRLNLAQFLMGSLLQIKPLLSVIDGRITPFEKIRTYKKAKERILELFDRDAKNGEASHVSILHANNYDEAKRWQEEIEGKYPHITSTISFVGPVVGVHVGPGTIGLSWFKM